ncbi:DUF5615 family PIN-like protein [Aerosakkonema funiforme]|uniref:DUF5615 family PIN-like protein n=1 Tax=Aerosakkonema funiforme FACHB-1375 TaxID=2949571 RepID=A0A926VHQ8_9CYAN|nr:DUF5615 family PIN-like protein [Aerosakkonema funiforme]MBD2184211.1 DUF5615 family PIN-like protein [Aerosakkonema funiforme FACHB-1375]
MKIRFLLDENLSKQIKMAVLRLNSSIDILCVGEPDAPPFGTLDPEILSYVDLSQRLLVTDNRKSMPGHLELHWAEGKQIWGLVWVRPATSLGKLAESIYLLWETYEAQEWIDRVDWIP